MKKIVFTLQMIFLILVLPVYMFVELSRPTSALQKTPAANSLEQTNIHITPGDVDPTPAHRVLTTGTIR